MKLQRWLAAKEDLHIKTFKQHGLAFNVVDAELVDVASGHRSQTNRTHSFKGETSTNGVITQALRDLAPTIDRLKINWPDFLLSSHPGSWTSAPSQAEP